MQKYWFQNNQYCNVQNMQKVIVGCWKCDFDKILLLYSENNSIIWIYEWTCWTTRWPPTQFRWVARCQSNCNWIDSSGALTSRTANLETAWIRPVHGPKAPVRNCCYHSRSGDLGFPEPNVIWPLLWSRSTLQHSRYSRDDMNSLQ